VVISTDSIFFVKSYLIQEAVSSDDRDCKDENNICTLDHSCLPLRKLLYVPEKVAISVGGVAKEWLARTMTTNDAEILVRALSLLSG